MAPLQAQGAAAADAERAPGDALADDVVASLHARAREEAATSSLGDGSPLVTLFIDVASAIQRERARIAAGRPADSGPRRPPQKRAPEPPPVAEPAAVPLVEHLELTGRQLEVVECLSRGLSNAETAAELFVSPNTVKTMAARIAERLDVRGDRAAIVGAAYRRGLLPLPAVG